MSRKNKLQKFSDILAFPNVFECYNTQQPQLVGAGMVPIDLKGCWQANYFKNNNPITLELACGGGEYTVGMARMYPDRNFIGVDIKGNRIWSGANQAINEGLHNVAFVRARIEIIDHFFAAGEVAEIWITFADPFPRSGKENRRLTSAHFNDLYRKILQTGGLVHLKHDDPAFYAFTQQTLAADPRCQVLYDQDDIYTAPLAYPELDLKTRYETMHLAKGRKIKYMRYMIG
jgi:tRNA (guanine-N7-)-methyltransferase